jgi:thiamine-monophosphate kinase
MIDISDGLASEVFHIAKSSNVGIKVFEEHLPIDKETFETAAEFSMDPLTAALNGGEDYELLFTINQADFEKLKKHSDIHFIGHIDKPGTGKILVTRKGVGVELQAQGWNHFPNKGQSSG